MKEIVTIHLLLVMTCQESLHRQSSSAALAEIKVQNHCRSHHDTSDKYLINKTDYMLTEPFVQLGEKSNSLFLSHVMEIVSSFVI